MRAQLASEAKDRRSRLTLLMGGRTENGVLMRVSFQFRMEEGGSQASIKERLCGAFSTLSSKFKFMNNIKYDMNKIETFKNESFGEVRVAGTSANPTFCLADVCKVLELGNPSQVKTRLGDGVISNEVIPDTLGRQQEMTFINEDGLYDVILDSRKPQAKSFRKWITSEVLPSIRKTGNYSVKELSRKELAQMVIEAEEEKERLQLEVKKRDEQIAADAPRVLFSKAVETAKRSCLVAELAKILQQNGVKIGQNRLFAWMRKNGYLCSKGQYYNQPTQKSMELGLFELKQTTINKPDGSVLVSTTKKVSGSGQVYFVNKFLNR